MRTVCCSLVIHLNAWEAQAYASWSVELLLISKLSAVRYFGHLAKGIYKGVPATHAPHWTAADPPGKCPVPIVANASLMPLPLR